MAYPVLPDEMELLQHLVTGDEKSFARIYEAYQGRVFLFAYRFTKSKEAADEVVQEVFVRLWTKRENIILPGFFSSANHNDSLDKYVATIMIYRKSN